MSALSVRASSHTGVVGPGSGGGAGVIGPGSGFVIPPPRRGLPSGDLPSLIAQIVKMGLLLVGVIALAFIVYGGFRYITSRGDEREVEEAKNTITYAVIGIIVIGLAYAIISFVVAALGGGSTGGG